MKVAAEARAKYGYDELEFYGVSCVGVPDLCQTYSIRSYPSVFAIPADAAVDDRQNIGSGSFSISKIEKALQLTLIASKAERQLKSNEKVDAAEDTEADLDEGVVEIWEEDEENEEEGGKIVDNLETDDDTEENNGKVPVDDEQDVEDPNVGSDDEQVLGGDHHDSRDVEFNSWKSHAETVPLKPKAGAEIAKEMPRTMDQWKEIQKQRIREQEYKWLKQRKAKPGSLGMEIINDQGATAIMLANRNGTKEFTERQKELLKVIERLHSSRERRGKMTSTDMERNQLPFKKQVSNPRLVENLPIVKRIVRMSAEEALILDASLSFLEGIRVGVYKSPDPLSSKQKRALKDWLDLLSISLPPEWALHETIGDLAENIDFISQSSQQLKAVLKKHRFPREKWSKSCGREHGFTCGFWKLLHIMTVGVAEHRGGLDLIASGVFHPNTRVFSPDEAADTLREYMAYFFTCTDCARHFIGQYDQCEMNRRCRRLTGLSSTATDADWKELAKWLWEFHNDINVRISKERYSDKRRKRSVLFRSSTESGVTAVEDQVNVLWPRLDECFECVNADGTFNEEAIFLYLERTYWPGHNLKDTPRGLIWLDDDGQGAIGLNFIFLLIGLVVVVVFRNRVARASFAHTMLKAKSMGFRAAHGRKLRTT